jgi:hypothetical protein
VSIIFAALLEMMCHGVSSSISRGERSWIFLLHSWLSSRDSCHSSLLVCLCFEILSLLQQHHIFNSRQTWHGRHWVSES